MEVSDIKKLLSDILEAKSKYEEAKQVSTDLYKKYQGLQFKMLDVLEAEDMKKFPGGEYNVSVSFRSKVKLSPIAEEKEQFFNWLKSKGVFYEYATVNPQSLNKLYKTELDLAFANQHYNFSIPGVSEPELQKVLSIRKASK